jgi:hypothetical protein
MLYDLSVIDTLLWKLSAVDDFSLCDAFLFPFMYCPLQSKNVTADCHSEFLIYCVTYIRRFIVYCAFAYHIRCIVRVYVCLTVFVFREGRNWGVNAICQ